MIYSEKFINFVIKSKPEKKNITFPDMNLVKEQLRQSLEELSVDFWSDDWKKLYKHIKNAELVYRVSVQNYFEQFSGFKSKRSRVKQLRLKCTSSI